MHSKRLNGNYIGIMSGTSLDGIDIALVDFSQDSVRMTSATFTPYPQKLREKLLELHIPSQNELHTSQLIANDLSVHYAGAVNELLQCSGMAAADIQAIGCHGQTIRHCPEQRYTIQLGNGALLAELTGITVVNDFRSRDLAAGGQGAPLVPAFHQYALRHPDRHRVIVNIGGISNLTDLAPYRMLAGFDCGPGNILLDAWAYLHTGQLYDKDGDWAASGQVIQKLLNTMLDEPFFSQLPPKSTGRDLFNMSWLESKLNGAENPADVQATLLALTGQTITDAIMRFCNGAEEIYLCGGGAHNKALIQYLVSALPSAEIQLTDKLGIAADWMEAIAFAWLARQTMSGKTSSLPGVTGAGHPSILGAIYQA